MRHDPTTLSRSNKTTWKETKKEKENAVTKYSYKFPISIISDQLSRILWRAICVRGAVCARSV